MYFTLLPLKISTSKSSLCLSSSHAPDEFPSSSKEEFAGWRSTSLLHKECCCISLGMRFITASKQGSCANRIGGIPTLLNTHARTHRHGSRTKRHKANKSWESWFRRQRGTSRTLILPDCSLLCTSKWRITVSVVRMAAGCLELNRHFFLFLFLFFFSSLNNGAVPLSGTQRSRTCGSWMYSSGQRSSALSAWKDTQGSILEMASCDPGKKAQIRPIYRPI